MKLAFTALRTSFGIAGAEHWLEAFGTIFAAMAGEEPAEHVFEVQGSIGDASLDKDGVNLLSNVAAWAILDRVVWEVNQLAWASAPDLILLHAGAVSIGERAVLIPGATSAGKSTLTAALCCAGARYLSDEIAVIDPSTCAVHPYPKPLSLRAGAQSRLGALAPPSWLQPYLSGTWYVPIVAGPPAPVAVVVKPSHEEGRATAVREVDPEAAYGALCAAASLGTRDGPGLRHIAESATSVELAANDLDIACEIIMALASAA